MSDIYHNGAVLPPRNVPERNRQRLPLPAADRYAYRVSPSAVLAGALSILAVLTAACTAPQGPPTVVPTAPASMRVTVTPGRVTFPDGYGTTIKGTELTFDAPVPLKDSLFSGKKTVAPVPGNFEQMHRAWTPWPMQGKPATLRPDATLPWNPIDFMLGSIYRGIDPASVTVMSADGKKTYEQGKDYVFNAEWGQIANNAGSMKGDGIRAAYAWYPRRLDLVQVDRHGTVSIKKGMPVTVCPRLPEPDADHLPLAGVYVATFDSFSVSADDVNMIAPAPPVAPVNADALPKTMAKLKAGEPVKIGIFGASTTQGAEAGPWWDDASLTYRGRIAAGLTKKYGSKVTEIPAYQGGRDVKQMTRMFHEKIVPRKPDVMTVHFGMNDAIRPRNGVPRNPPPVFKEQMRGIITAAKNAGTEVIIITPYMPHPATTLYANMPEYCDTLRSLAREEHVALADVNEEWKNLRTRGIPPYALLHNDNNHPGVDGHKVMADVVLRCFGVN